MFTVRADFNESFEVNASLERVREFFSEVENFIDLMPSIAKIREDANGIIHWKVIAQVPVVGSFTQKFEVFEDENSEERIEWVSNDADNKNIMRYSADFMQKGADKTLIQYSQNVELRRNTASQLHFLAGLAGESIISSEMTKGVAEMLDRFLEKAKMRMES